MAEDPWALEDAYTLVAELHGITLTPARLADLVAAGISVEEFDRRLTEMGQDSHG